MSQTVARPDTRTDAAVRVDAWLAELQEALTARDVDRAAALFGADSFWRDLVVFTWNIMTVEGLAGVADLLRATLDGIDPSGFQVIEEPTEAGWVTAVWLEFETVADVEAGTCGSPAARPRRC